MQTRTNKVGSTYIRLKNAFNIGQKKPQKGIKVITIRNHEPHQNDARKLKIRYGAMTLAALILMGLFIYFHISG